MSDELPPNVIHVQTPLPDFARTQPLFWSGGAIVHRDFQICRNLVLPAQHLRLEFKPDTVLADIRVLQRGLAERIKSAGLIGGYFNDDQYLVLSVSRPMQDADGDRLVNWLARQAIVAQVRFSDVQMLAQVLADVAGGEFCGDQPFRTARLLTLIGLMNHDWVHLRSSLREGLTEASGSPASSSSSSDQGDAS